MSPSHQNRQNDRFQSTLPQGSDHPRSTLQGIQLKFQSTLPQGSDLSSEPTGRNGLHFNPRSRKGATVLLYSLWIMLIFQSTLPQGSDNILETQLTVGKNFNPRSRKGATSRKLKLIKQKRISIHAPARERLVQLQHRLVSVPNFNPRSRKGATFNTLNFFMEDKNFNPRSRKGATWNDIFYSRFYRISIHAPARERHTHNSTISVNLIFQSTLPQGSDK